MIALGDNVAWSSSRDFPQYDAFGATQAYAMYRRHMAPLSTSCPHFGLIGNWEGESGKVPAESAARVAVVRRRFAPGPDNRTYPQGGSQNEDYYAFDWCVPAIDCLYEEIRAHSPGRTRPGLGGGA